MNWFYRLGWDRGYQLRATAPGPVDLEREGRRQAERYPEHVRDIVQGFQDGYHDRWEENA